MFGKTSDKIKRLRSQEKNDDRFSLIKVDTPDGFITGKWWGPQHVRPILCIHGWIDNCGAFDRLIPLLPKEYSYLAIDLPGHGLSSRYAPGMCYSYYDIVILIERIRKAYGWDKVSLMGHSLGAMCCFAYAAVFASKTDLLISLDNFTPRELNVVERMRMDMGFLLREDDRVDENGGREIEPPSYSYDELIDKLIKGSQDSVDLPTAKYLLTRSVKKSTKYPNKYYFNYDRRIRGMNIQALNPEDRMLFTKCISCPVLFLIGRDSYMRSSPQIPALDEIVAVKENFSYHIGPGNHHFLLTHPEEYSDVITKFLDQNKQGMCKL